MKIRPLQDRIMVQPILDKEVQKGGIIIPDSAKEKPIEGRVKAVGKGKIGDDGKPIKLEIKVGDKVLYSKYGGNGNQNRWRRLPSHERRRCSRCSREVTKSISLK